MYAAITVLVTGLLISPSQVQPQPQPQLSRAEVVTTDESAILYAYDLDDHVAAEIALTSEGLQASFDGLFLDVALEPDGTVTVACGGVACTDGDKLNAHAQLGAVAELLVQAPPEGPDALKLRCALTIAVGGAACAAGGVPCLIGFYLAACECMGEVFVDGKDVCDEIL